MGKCGGRSGKQYLHLRYHPGHLAPLCCLFYMVRIYLGPMSHLSLRNHRLQKNILFDIRYRFFHLVFDLSIPCRGCCSHSGLVPLSDSYRDVRYFFDHYDDDTFDSNLAEKDDDSISSAGLNFWWSTVRIIGEVDFWVAAIKNVDKTDESAQHKSPSASLRWSLNFVW